MFDCSLGLSSDRGVDGGGKDALPETIALGDRGVQEFLDSVHLAGKVKAAYELLRNGL